jgi:hypothetical protein
MENQDFTTTIMVDHTPVDIFKTLKNVRAWWSGLYDESFEGSSENIGDEFSFLAGGGVHYTKQKLVEIVPNKKIVWIVTESNLSFVETTDEWTGTKISFEIIPEGEKTKIIFTHIGLIPEFECYDSCAPAWTQYMQERLTHALAVEN